MTPLTVYRWELPEDRTDARRPRGASLAKLARIAGRSGREGREAAPTSDELAEIWPHIERVLSGEVRATKADLIDRLARKPPHTDDGRALAGVALALAELFGRGDGRAAIAVLANAVTDAETGRLARAVAARVYATAAFVHSLPDGRLFDLGKVHAFAGRAEALGLPAEDDDALHLARYAAVHAAMMIADPELLARAFDRLGRERPTSLILQFLHEECRGLELLVTGNTPAAVRAFEGLVESSADHPLIRVRAIGFLAIRRLDALAAPEQVLADVTMARALVQRAQIAHGWHETFLARASSEALLRLGRIDDARAELDALDAIDEETGFPSQAAVPARVRLDNVTGNVDDLRALLARLGRVTHPSLQAITLANRAFVEAMIAYLVEPIVAASQAFARAAVLARRWPFLDRDVTVTRVLVHVLAGETAAGDAALLHLGRIGEASTSAWLSSQILRLEATVHASRMDWARARPLLDAAAETLERGGDRPATAICRHMRDALADAFADPEREPGALATSRARLRELGIRAPAALAVGLELVRARPATARLTALQGVEALLVPFQRLSVRGASRAFLEREVVSVVQGLFRSEAWLDVVADGEEPDEGRRLGVIDDSAADFSDGAGRRLRITVKGLVSAEDRALLSLVAMHAALAMERASGRPEPFEDDVHASKDLPDFIAASPALRRLRGELTRLAPSHSTVIVTGESGSGKEVVARAVHALSDRKKGPFIAFNCAAVPRELFEGQLFGYRRGAFTGATENHPGVIRSATGGTLFLDEIGELPLELQPKLLRFLDSSEVFPLGETKPLKADVRVVTATNRDLAAMVRQGQFREDLYYRLQVVPIEVPPLRERPEDIVALARHFVRKLGQATGTRTVLAPDAIAKLTRHAWPGNVRELRNVIERALAFSPVPAALRAEHLAL